MEVLRDQETLEAFFSQLRVFIYKHSTRCEICQRAEKEVLTAEKVMPEEVKIFKILVLENRELSQAFAEKTGIRHESPQLVYLEKGEVKGVWNHFDITQEVMLKALSSP